MDPLSITASVVAVLQAANAIIALCYDFKALLKDGAPWGLSQILVEIQDLRNVLESMDKLAEPLAETKPSRKVPFELLCEPDTGPLATCARELKSLEGLITSHFDGKSGSKRIAMMRAIGWQLKDKEVKVALERVGRCKSTLLLAMTVDQAALLVDIQDMTTSLKSSVTSVEASLDTLVNTIKSRELGERQQAMVHWLSSTDPWESHEAALRLHQSGTNSWFTRCTEFNNWVSGSRSFLWLSGFPGAGKTILFSNTVTYLTGHFQRPQHRSTLAFFYCDFRRPETQDLLNVVGSLVAQICSQRGIFPSVVEQAFDHSHNGPGQKKRPSLALLRELLDLSATQSNLTLLIDAIDECQQRQELFDFFSELQSSSTNIRVMLTSREEAEIQYGLHSFEHLRIEGHLTEVNNDVRAYIANRLASDRKLQWLNDSVKDDIANLLMEKSAGMFRWVQCQIDAIEGLRTVKAIRVALRELPKGLDETYDKILSKVSSSDTEIVRRILVWVSFTMLPLTLREIHEAIAIEVGLDELDEDSRLRSPQDILDLCGSLLSVSENGHVRLAHLSVREYLLSPSMSKHINLSIFALDSQRANYELAISCLTYLSFRKLRTGPCSSAEAYTERLITYPLLGYAAVCWAYFVRKTTTDQHLRHLISELFSPQSRKTFMSWVQVLNAYNASWDFYPRHATPLYYAASFGLLDIVTALMQQNPNLDLNAPGSRFGGTALHAAVLREHVEVMRLLLDAGADPNRGDWNRVTPLHSAALYGTAQVIRMLLDYGASTEALDEEGRRPSDWAVDGGKLEAQRLVLRATEAELRVVRPTSKLNREESSKKSEILTMSGGRQANNSNNPSLTKVTTSTSKVEDRDDDLVTLKPDTYGVSVNSRQLAVEANTSRSRSRSPSQSRQSPRPLRRVEEHA